MTDRTYPTAAEAREAARGAVMRHVLGREGAPCDCGADWECKYIMRAIERAQQAAVREALIEMAEHVENQPHERIHFDDTDEGEYEYMIRLSLTEEIHQRYIADAERALDALEEAR